MDYENLSPLMNVVLSQAKKSVQAKSDRGIRYDPAWILDGLNPLLRIRCYVMMASYLLLTSIGILNQKIKSQRSAFGFDTALFAGLKQSLLDFFGTSAV